MEEVEEEREHEEEEELGLPKISLTPSFESFLAEGVQDVASMAEFGVAAIYLKERLRSKTKSLIQHQTTAWEKIRGQLPLGPSISAAVSGKEGQDFFNPDLSSPQRYRQSLTAVW